MAPYLLLINNVIVRDELGRPIMQERKGVVPYYTNGRTTENLDHLVQDEESKLISQEMKDPMYEVVAGKSFVESVSNRLGIVMRYSPLYILKQKLASQPEMRRMPGFDIDLRSLFDKEIAEFYVNEFGKFAHIMDWIEKIVHKNRVKVGSPLAINKNDNRMMNILWVESNILYNPLNTFPGIRKFRLFRNCFTKAYEEDQEISLALPDTFRTRILRGQVDAVFGTSTDIMKMCNIDFCDTLSSKEIYSLISGICIRNTFASKEIISPYILELPTGVSVYIPVNTVTGDRGKTFFDATSAAVRARQLGNDWQVVDFHADALYVKRAFPKFKDKDVGLGTDLVQKIGGAEFVQY